MKKIICCKIFTDQHELLRQKEGRGTWSGRNAWVTQIWILKRSISRSEEKREQNTSYLLHHQSKDSPAICLFHTPLIANASIMCMCFKCTSIVRFFFFLFTRYCVHCIYIECSVVTRYACFEQWQACHLVSRKHPFLLLILWASVAFFLSFSSLVSWSCKTNVDKKNHRLWQ